MQQKQKRDQNDSLENGADIGLLAEAWSFLRENKKYWLIPILIVFSFFGLLLALAGTGAAPFIYTLF
ncbi:MAG: hypothetical protein KJ630_09600 [Proteobacteria bacterium]|nr:hypothetical protein [Pseudomonadota bacterium]